jgi:N-acetylglucosaminyldiphosphoundecaprenol N-acetyl-beta-D-mannosaminyltransferase
MGAERKQHRRRPKRSRRVLWGEHFSAGGKMVSSALPSHAPGVARRNRSPSLVDLMDALRIVPDDNGRDHLLDQLRSAAGPVVVAFINAQAMNIAWRDLAFRQCLGEADFVLRDGIGMKVGLSALGRTPGLNMNGTDFIPQLLRYMSPATAAFFGSELRFAAAAAINAEKIGIEPLAIRGGFERDTIYIDLAARTRPEIIVLGMGMPKQERVALMMRDALVHPCIIIAGGAIIDFMAAKFPRAPRMLRNAGLEWLFRLSLEPRRLASRYLGGNVSFLLKMAFMRAALRSFGSPLPDEDECGPGGQAPPEMACDDTFVAPASRVGQPSGIIVDKRFQDAEEAAPAIARLTSGDHQLAAQMRRIAGYRRVETVAAAESWMVQKRSAARDT